MADKMLFMVAAMAAEMERHLIRERTLDGLRAAAAQGRTGALRRPGLTAMTTVGTTDRSEHAFPEQPNARSSVDVLTVIWV
jgi:DNA invertase Pin-like site-specific DNA recombinase